MVLPSPERALGLPERIPWTAGHTGAGGARIATSAPRCVVWRPYRVGAIAKYAFAPRCRGLLAHLADGVLNLAVGFCWAVGGSWGAGGRWA